MYRLARRLLYDPQESKDVVSEVFARLLRGGVMPDSGKMEGYLMTAMRFLYRRCISDALSVWDSMAVNNSKSTKDTEFDSKGRERKG